jgi:hypothetical protein
VKVKSNNKYKSHSELAKDSLRCPTPINSGYISNSKLKGVGYLQSYPTLLN